MKLILFLIAVLGFEFGFGQSIFNNPITAADPSASNPFTTGQTVAGGITVSGIGRGTGISAATASNRYAASGWSTGAIDLNDYFQFTITPSTCINFVSFVYTSQASGTGPTSFSFRSSVDGFVSNIGTPNATGTTINLSAASYQNITAPITFRIYGFNSGAAGGTFSINDFTFNGNQTCSGNTITTGVISTAPFNLPTCASAAAGSVAYTSTGVFTGNTYSVQISDATGSFAAPVTIGTLGSNANSGSINFTIPAGTVASALYRLRVISSSPVTIGSNSAAFTITSACATVCPKITGALINGCAGPCGGEGSNEILFLNSGSYPITVNSTNLNISFNGNNFTGAFNPQPAVISNLNTLAGCGTLFIDASLGVIPANKTFFIMNQGSCFDFDFSSYCSFAPIYVAFANDVSWPASGFFTNSGGTTRTFNTNFSSIAGACGSTDYDYIPDDLTSFAASGDGGSVIFGSPNNYVNTGCTPPAIILPVQLIDFYCTKNNSQNEIVWKVAQEENIENYIIEKSENGIDFTNLSIILPTSQIGTKSYNIVDDSPFKEITYYRLKTTEANGEVITYKIISADNNSKDLSYIYYQQANNLIIEFKNSLPKNTNIEIFDLSGKPLISSPINESQSTFNLENLASGIYFVRITTAYKTEHFKIIVSK